MIPWEIICNIICWNRESDVLTFDFEKLEHISSAGLRVLLSAQKIMNWQGGMKLIRVKEPIMEVFEITGFCDIINIE